MDTALHSAFPSALSIAWNAHDLAGRVEGAQESIDSPQAAALWRSTALPSLRKRPALGVTGKRSSSWIMRERPGWTAHGEGAQA